MSHTFSIDSNINYLAAIHKKEIPYLSSTYAITWSHPNQNVITFKAFLGHGNYSIFSPIWKMLIKM